MFHFKIILSFSGSNHCELDLNVGVDNNVYKRE